MAVHDVAPQQVGQGPEVGEIGADVHTQQDGEHHPGTVGDERYQQQGRGQVVEQVREYRGQGGDGEQREKACAGGDEVGHPVADGALPDGQDDDAERRDEGEEREIDRAQTRPQGGQRCAQQGRDQHRRGTDPRDRIERNTERFGHHEGDQ